MPKIINDLEEAVLEEARRVLLSSGYEALTMRSIASACHVAVGTLYNYFPSKDVLAARVMLKDWRTALERMDRAAGEARTALEGLESIFRELMAFCDIYVSTWDEYARGGNTAPIHGRNHFQLVGQLEQSIRHTLERTGGCFTPALPGFLAEALLSASARGEARFGELIPVFERLLQE